jgi:hypothetical protein
MHAGESEEPDHRPCHVRIPGRTNPRQHLSAAEVIRETCTTHDARYTLQRRVS